MLMLNTEKILKINSRTSKQDSMKFVTFFQVIGRSRLALQTAMAK